MSNLRTTNFLSSKQATNSLRKTKSKYEYLGDYEQRTEKLKTQYLHSKRENTVFRLVCSLTLNLSNWRKEGARRAGKYERVELL